MPGLSFEKLPADTPQTTLQRNLQSAQQQIAGQYNQRLQTIRRTPMSDRDFSLQYNKLTQSFQTDMQKITQPFQQREQQLQTIQRLVQQGHITADRGNEALWRTVLPQETERAMFAPAGGKPPAPFSPTQLTSYGESAAEFVEAAEKTVPVEKWYRFGPIGRYERPAKDALTKQYAGWQEYIGYQNLSPVRQRQADIQWDDYIKGKDIEEWDPKDPQIKALRSKGRLTRAMAPTMTPVARTLIQAKRTQGGGRLTLEMAQRFVDEAGGDREKGRQIARSRGYSF